MASLQAPPRTFGFLLATLGVLLAGGGFYLLSLGAPPVSAAYFVVAGIGIFLSGMLIARDMLIGAWLYAAVFLLMVVWSFIELGGDVQAALPRIALPGLICAYIFLSKFRERLA